MINMSNQYHRGGEKESEVAVRVGGGEKRWEGKRGGGQGGGEVGRWPAGFSATGCARSNRPEHIQHTLPWATDGKLGRQFLRSGYQRKVLLMLCDGESWALDG